MVNRYTVATTGSNNPEDQSQCIKYSFSKLSYITMDVTLHSLAHLLQSCNFHQGKQLHLLFFKKGILNSTVSIANRLLQMYMRCGHAWEASHLFDEMPHRNTFSWNTMVEGYMKSGKKEKSLTIFNLMPYKNEFSWNLVISGFSKVGELETARGLFNDMPTTNGVAWNSMIHGYWRNGYPREALRLFKEINLRMFDELRGDTYVLATVIGICTDMGALECGKQIHSRIVIDGLEFDSVLASSMVNLYGKCGDLVSANNVLNMMKEPDDFSLSALISGYSNCGRTDDARTVFEMISKPSGVLWNSLISGYISNGEETESLILFKEMRGSGVKEDSSIFTSVLNACSLLGNLECSKQIHSLACKIGIMDDVIVASALVDAYSKCGMPSEACKLYTELRFCDTILLNTMVNIYSSCGRIEDAKQIFKTMPNKSLISWNSMIVGLSQNGCPMEASHLFCEMNKLNLRIDKISLAGVISACASISSLELGEQIFARAIVIGLESDQIICTSLVDFYCKCGILESGRKVFDAMVKSDEISWNSMLMGYATNGQGYEALALFNEMRNASVKPTNITFTGVLSACDHCGLVEEGRKWFDVMKWDYHIDPEIEHYSCMIDLFARAGCLEEAVNLMEKMPYEADASMWSSILRGCVAHGDKNLGKKVSEKIIEIEPDNSGAYVQLSSIFADAGEWEKSLLVRKAMREKQVRKKPGFSWTDC